MPLRFLLTILFCIVVLCCPAMGRQDVHRYEQVFLLSAQQTRVICPVCAETHDRSTVQVTFDDPPCPNNCREFWDKDGNYHNHKLYPISMVCSKGHIFYFFSTACECRWPYAQAVACPPEE